MVTTITFTTISWGWWANVSDVYVVEFRSGLTSGGRK